MIDRIDKRRARMGWGLVDGHGGASCIVFSLVLFYFAPGCSQDVPVTLELEPVAATFLKWCQFRGVELAVTVRLAAHSEDTYDSSSSRTASLGRSLVASKEIQVVQGVLLAHRLSLHQVLSSPPALDRRKGRPSCAFQCLP